MPERQRPEWPPELLSARVQFWTCLNKAHRTVTWNGDVATCGTCGLTSEMTRRYANDVARYVREKAPDWPAARKAIDTAISRARREIQITVEDALGSWGLDAVSRQCIGETILNQVQDSLDDVDQTIPPEEDQ